MKRLLRFSPQARHLNFHSQYTDISSLLTASPLSPAYLNTQIPTILAYPSEAIHKACTPSLKSALSRLIQQQRSELQFDAEYFGLKFADLSPAQIDIKKASNEALFEAALKSSVRDSMKNEVKSRLDSMTKGELIRFLWLFPDSQLKSRLLAHSGLLKSSEEFYYLCQLKKTLTVPELTFTHVFDMYQQFEAEEGAVDANFLSQSLQYFNTSFDYLVRSRILNKLSDEIIGLSPSALKHYVDHLATFKMITAIPNIWIKWIVENLEEMELMDIDDQMIVELLDALRSIEGRMKKEFRERLAHNLTSRLPKASLVSKARLMRCLYSYKLSPASVLIPQFRYFRDLAISSESSSAYIQCLPAFIDSDSFSIPDLIKFLQSASLADLSQVAKVMQTFRINSYALDEAVSLRLLMLIDSTIPVESVLLHCEILGRIYKENRKMKNAAAKLAAIILSHPEWIMENHVVAFAHQFSYVTFHYEINELIVDFVKKNQQTEVVADTISSETQFYYKENGKFRMPQNVFLNSKSRSQVAVLLISLLRGRKLDPAIQEIIRQYVKTLITYWPVLKVKHRSSLVLGVSLRENFDVKMWNALALSVNRLECHEFRSEETMKSLTVYKTAARNVKNLLRRIKKDEEWPIEIWIKNEKLEEFTKTQPFGA